MNDKQALLREGLRDAVCFMLGCLAGYGLGRLLGLDVFAEGYSGTSIFAILLVGLGGGAGVQLGRRLLS